MKKCLRIFTCICLLSSFAGAQTLPGGTYQVGTSMTYTNLNDVANALKTNTVTGDLIFELQSSYNTILETFPLTFNQFATLGGNWTVTIRPAAGTTIVTEGDGGVNSALINLDSIDRLILDGRAGGMGGIAWTIRNKCAIIGPSATAPTASLSAGPAIQFMNEATHDTLRYIQFESMAPSADRSVVFFSTSVGTVGNSFNGVHYCNIRDRSDTTAGVATPAAAIISIGPALPTNNYNTIANNNIFNFFSPNVQTHAIRVNNATGWAIRDNRVFQEQPRTFLIGGINHKIFRIDNGSSSITSCTNHIIEGNIVGYSAANGTGTYEIAGTLANVLTGMDLNFSQSGNNIIRRNTFTNIKLSTASTQNVASPNGVFSAINLNQGYFTIDSNIIGSKTDTSSILILGSGAAAGVYGISITAKTGLISSNFIGGITIDNIAASGNARISFCGISTLSAGANTIISNNTIGGKNPASSIINRSGITNTATGHTTIGINIQASPTQVTNNIVSNLLYSGGSTTAQVIGINSGGTTTAQKIGTLTNGTGNEINDLFNNAPNIGTGTSASIIGILNSNTTAGQLITQNKIYGLVNTHPTAAVTVEGIQYAGNTSNSGDVVSRNLIHSLNILSSNTASTIIGINTGTSTCSYQNNIIRLGIDTSANSITTGYSIIGINNNPAGTGTDEYYHNTIYIGGVGVAAVSNTYAFNRTSGTNTTNLVNNILVNVRSNISGTGVNYVLRNNNTTNSGLNANYNLYHRNSVGGGKLFSSSALSFDSVWAWQSFNSPTALDINSGIGDPMLINPDGTKYTLDLGLQTNNPAEGMGIALAKIVDDYKGNSRGLNTPNDPGAISGNYNLVSDIYAPVVSYSNIGTGVVAATKIVSGIIITDNFGVSSAPNKPRIYYKKKNEANQFIGNTSGDNGWKYVVASNASSPYSFTIDYSLLFSSLVATDTIYYFVAAQDNSNNFVSSPAGAGYLSNPSIQYISNAPSVTNSFVIGNNGISGSKTVCASSCDFSSLTGVGGLFQAMDSLAVTGNITATISSDLLEDGTYGLNYFGDATLTIVPDLIQRTISNSKDLVSTVPLISINGGANITIDGGVAKNLIFKNTNAVAANTSATIQFNNGANNNTLKNCVVQNNGSATARANIIIGGGSSNIMILNNQITDTSNASTQQPGNCILSNSTLNSNLTIANNEIYNFRANGISIATFGSNCLIKGNHIYNNTLTIPTTGFNGISITSGTGHMVDSNYIGGQAPMLGGGTWTFTSNTASFGIAYSSPGSNSIQNNKIGFFTGTISAVVAGINATGSANPLIITKNEIHDITSAGTNGGLFLSLGGIIISSTNQSNQITENTIYNLTSNAASGSPGAAGIGTNGTASYIAGGQISRNKIYGFQMSVSNPSTPDIKGIGPLQGNSTAMNLTISNNFISVGENITNNVQMEGIWNNAVAASVINVYNNTLYVSGVIGASTVSTSAYLKSNNAIGGIKNNIFYNMRTKSSGIGVHTAITNSVTTPSTGWMSDYNLLYSSDTTTAAVTWGTVTYGYSPWKILSLADANDVSKDVFFNSASVGDLHLTGTSIGDLSLKGTPLAAISEDFDGQLRNIFTPYMGADENLTAPLPIKLVSFNGVLLNDNVLLSWQTAFEINNKGFMVQRSVDGKTFETIGFVEGKGSSSKVINYTLIDERAFARVTSSQLYYRLKQIDFDGKTNYSNYIVINKETFKSANQLIVYPNPFDNELFIKLEALEDNDAIVSIFELTGKLISTKTKKLQKGNNLFYVEEAAVLKAGIYYLSVEIDGKKVVSKLVK
jgi:trimeric autotransporter adhesin